MWWLFWRSLGQRVKDFLAPQPKRIVPQSLASRLSLESQRLRTQLEVQLGQLHTNLVMSSGLLDSRLAIRLVRTRPRLKIEVTDLRVVGE